MTLPSNSLPSENATFAGDLLAVLGQPAPAGGIQAQPAAPFSDLLASVGAPAPANAAPAQTPATTPMLEAMYSNRCYTTVLPPEAISAEAVADVAVEDCATETDEPAATTDDEGVLLIAYQLLAGQWVPQPPVPVATTKPENAAPTTEGELGVSAFHGCATRSKTDFAPVVATPAITNQTAAKPNLNPPAPPPASPGQSPVPVAAKMAAPSEPSLLPDPTQSNLLGHSAAPLQKPAPIEKPASAENPTAVPPEGLAIPTAATPTVAKPSLTSPAPQSLPNQSQVATQSTGPVTPEKFAAPGSLPAAETASGVNSPKQSSEKKTLVVDGKGQKSGARQIGTAAANREYAMSSSAANTPSALPVQALPQVVSAGGIHQGTTQAVAEAGATTAAQAPRLVQEIHAIAERISTIDRNTVEVRFDFNESDRLSVRVEYRDGVVQTTFRTDSDSLRTAIAREWHVQAAPAEARNYRVAEPTFSTNSGSSVDLSQSGLGSGHSQSRTFEQGSPGLHGFVRPGRASSLTSSEVQAPSVSLVARPETSRRLHTFA